MSATPETVKPSPEARRQAIAGLRAAALRHDAEDPLRSFREQFSLPFGALGHGAPLEPAQGMASSAAVYLCGHSLGLAPRAARCYVDEELDRWQHSAVEGHFHGPRPWVSYHELLAPGLALLAGAEPGEVVAMNSLTVNLNLLLISFYRPTRERWKILLEAGAFPSDRYAVASHARLHGFDPAEAIVEIKARAGESCLREEDVERLLAEEGSRIATVLLPGVQYLTGQVFDMQRLAAAARTQGCVVGFDLAHAIGNVPLRLHDWNADFAVWCSYKYLNAGPGAIGGCFVHARHARRTDLPRLAGWWGHDAVSRFDMPELFAAMPGAQGWQLSNPPIFAAAPLLASLQLFAAAGLPALFDKSRRLSSFMLELLAPCGDFLEIVTPPEKARHGCQISLRLRPGVAHRLQGQELHERLQRRGIFGDWREPDILRAAPVPLYNSFEDVWKFAAALCEELA
jgi:kynureninase